MSVFDPTTGEQATPPATGQEDTPPQDNFLDKIVADKGEQWKDPEVVAKGYLHAQQEIERLKAFEQRANEQDYAKALLDKLQGQAGAGTPPKPEDTVSTAAEENTTPKAEDIESLIADVLTKRDAETRTQKNIAEADKLMTETFGTEAKATLTNRAQELGMSTEYLQNIAAESPSAFMQLMGQAPAKETNSAPIGGTVNTLNSNLQGKDERDMKYYLEMMRKNPKQYGTKETQRQMLEDKAKLGSRFFNQ